MKMRVHYGWIVTLGCGIMVCYSMGLTVNCFSMFIEPLIDTIGLTKTEGSSIPSVQNMLGLCSMIFAGPLFNKFGVRSISYLSGLLIASGFLVFSFAKNLIVCYIAAGFIGIGYGTGSIIAVSVILTSWFDEKRGFAMGLATVGSGISTIIYPPILAFIINNFSVSTGFQFLFINVVILATISFMLVRNCPADKGLRPYRSRQCIKKELYLGNVSLNFKEAVRTKKYYMIMFATAAVSISVLPTISHVSVLYTSTVYSPVFAAAMLSLYGATMMISKPLYGFINDRFGLLFSNIYVYSCWILSLISGIVLDKNIVFAYFFILFLGMGSPLSTIAMPLWVSTIFGKRDYSTIFSSVNILFYLGGAISLTLPGLLADLTGSYLSIFPVYIILSVISLIILLSVIINNNKKIIDYSGIR